jgi:hypothetical protein
VLAAIRFTNTNDVPEIVPTTKILPAGTSTDVVVRRDFDSQTTYRVVIDGSPIVLLSGSQVIARRLPADNQLLKDGVVTATSTLVTMLIPSSVGGAWPNATTYVYGCKAGQPGPIFVASLVMPVSYAPYSAAIVWVFLIVAYVLIASAAKFVDKQGLSWVRYLDPVVLTAGSDGKGNLAKLQILFFSIIVAGLAQLPGFARQSPFRSTR